MRKVVAPPNWSVVVAHARRVEKPSADAGLELRESSRIAIRRRGRIAVHKAVFLALGAKGQNVAFDEAEIALVIEFYALAFIKAWYDRGDVRVGKAAVIIRVGETEGLIEAPIEERHMREAPGEELGIAILAQHGFRPKEIIARRIERRLDILAG